MTLPVIYSAGIIQALPQTGPNGCPLPSPCSYLCFILGSLLSVWWSLETVEVAEMSRNTIKQVD